MYQVGSAGREPEGWAGFTCAGDAQIAGEQLDAFRKRAEFAERPLRSGAPDEPARIWQRAAGGVYGVPLRRGERALGVALVGW